MVMGMGMGMGMETMPSRKTPLDLGKLDVF